jgi:hypothetical protein
MDLITHTHSLLADPKSAKQRRGPDWGNGRSLTSDPLWRRTTGNGGIEFRFSEFGFIYRERKQSTKA